MKTLIKKLIPVEIRLCVMNLIDRIFAFFCTFLPLKERVLFYSVRDDEHLLDNSDAVYNALDYEKIIFTQKLPHYIKTRFKAIILIKTSKVIVTDDYCKYLRILKLKKCQKVIQIWHACGAYKCFGLDAESRISRKDEKLTHSQYDAVIVTGEGCKDAYSSAFGIDIEKIKPLGLPRTDDIVNNPEKMKDDFFLKHPDLRDKTIYLYCPTFRENKGSYVEFDCNINFKLLNESLNENEVFIIRKHPTMNYDLLSEKYDKIIDMTYESTLLLTSVSSVLITDYSSSFYDALLFNVPCLFYCPDAESYERNFYLKFPEDLPGNVIINSDSLIDEIRLIKEKPPISKMDSFKKSQLEFCDGKSTNRVVSLIKEYIDF